MFRCAGRTRPKVSAASLTSHSGTCNLIEATRPSSDPSTSHSRDEESHQRTGTRVDWSALGSEYRLGVVFGLATAVCYATYLLCFRHAQSLSRALPAELPARELAIVSLAAAAMLAGVAGVEGESLAIPSWQDAGWLVAYALFAHIFGWLLIASSLAHVPAALIGLSLLLQPLLSFVWDVLLFDRPVTPTELAGAALALAAIYLGARKPGSGNGRRRAVG